ncbi:MAG: GNAT family protein [Capsulimonadales bacterium]|nr:GNAT family protein [Capsulimonadales bacterium]
MESLLVRPVVLVGRSVRLEPVSMAHFPDLAEQAIDPDIWQYMGSGNLSDPERLHGCIEAAVRETRPEEGVMFAAVATATGRAVGMTGLYDVHPVHRRLELGRTWYGRDYRRTAINTESKYLLLTHCFETLSAHRVTIKTDTRNERSQRAIERIGATREGVLRHHMVLWDGYVRDTVYYGIIAPEWPHVKAHLERLLMRGSVRVESS